MARKSRNTIQKENLEKISHLFDDFFSAEELHLRAQRQNPEIGIATVYRFLKERSKQGVLHQYECGKKMVYSNKPLSHSHFTCEKCGRKLHFGMKGIDILKNKFPGKACHFQLEVYGTCDMCLKK